ncbi:FtsK/SpoIIIE domain-containing protein [Microbacterium sp. P07]|uniref:FtsK/SpoIIIE domain-containing protein n=1 Tax=Microbacterium sp. P07 TaxID=3366952 RepID=UPI00374672AA
MPVVGALGFWAFTGSVFALWFALLGPVIAVAGVVDGARTARRARREANEEAAIARARVGVEVEDRHAAERSALRSRHPDVAGYLAHPEQIWRSVPDRMATIVIGAGSVPSGVRLSGGGDDDATLTRRARSVANAPVVLPASTGIVVVGPALAAESVVRALALQLALARAPGELTVTGPEAPWVRSLPHATTTAPFVVGVGRAGDAFSDADLVLVSAAPGEALPPRCDTVLFLVDAESARVEARGEVHRVVVEALSALQADVIARELTSRARSLEPTVPDTPPVTLASLGLARREGAPKGLSVPVGVTGTRIAELDIVADGPHAVVTGMTGAGKSELLVTWVVALCTAYETSAVSLLLADFKGGTAFDALAHLPHVTGVITDLDSAAARRAIESLRAELRHREAELARSGARDIAEVDLPRLVIVVDEFAVLRETHPELEALFTDIAARGRALGMHLVIGTQRASGVLRDGLLANCPLRLSLRVSEAHDSRTVVGTDEAATLPGGAGGRGLAIVRRAGDARTSRVRMALSDHADIAAVAGIGGERARRPWLPVLPSSIALTDLRVAEPGVVALGLVDEPDRQRQGPYVVEDRALLVVGGARSGKTTTLRMLAAQVPEASRLWIGPDPESAWDALAAGVPPVPGTAVIVDDLDALAGRLPGEYGRIAAEELERWIRGAGDLGLRVFSSAQRLTGPAGRLADLFPRRLVLGTASRSDHLAVGGDGADFIPDLPPGRGTIDRRSVQVATTSDPWAGEAGAASAPLWEPHAGVSGYVVRHCPPGVVERWERTGVRIREVDGPGDVSEPEPEGRVVIIGDPEQWMGHPRLLARVRNMHTLIVDVSCAGDYRLLTGDRDLPPFAEAGRGRAWECRAGRRARRVAIAGVRGG